MLLKCIERGVWRWAFFIPRGCIWFGSVKKGAFLWTNFIYLISNHRFTERTYDTRSQSYYVCPPHYYVHVLFAKACYGASIVTTSFSRTSFQQSITARSCRLPIKHQSARSTQRASASAPKGRPSKLFPQIRNP